MWRAGTGQRRELKKDKKETTRVELENKGQRQKGKRNQYERVCKMKGL